MRGWSKSLKFLGIPLAVAAWSCVDQTSAPRDVGTASLKVTGNGAPSGSHYNLNIIGVDKGKTADMTGTQGKSLFVALTGNTKINLTEGPFEVLDRNGTDGVAAFQLPAPDPDGGGWTSYSVWARALGKPGGSSVTTTCITDIATGDVYCSTESMVLVRSGGQSKFRDVSKELLTVCADFDSNGTCDRRISLFSDDNFLYFWSYDNSGLKLAQLRFYEVPSFVGTTP